jgi:hypothetical protein
MMIQAPLNKLAIDGIDIERIVREVLASLVLEPTAPAVNNSPAVSAPQAITSVPALNTASASRSASTGNTASADNSDPVFVQDSVVSIQILKALPAGTRRVRLTPQALVTPAAKDWFRERRIEWARGDFPTIESSATSTASNSTTTNNGLTRIIPTRVALTAEASAAKSMHPKGANPIASLATPVKIQTEIATPPLFITGSVLWLRSLERQVCPKQTKLDAMQSDDAAAIRAVASALRSGHRAAVAIVQAPHSALWQSARDEALRPAVVSQWSDLTDILFEVPANLLIIPAKRWTIPGVCNVIRKFTEQIQSNR